MRILQRRSQALVQVTELQSKIVTKLEAELAGAVWLLECAP